MRCQCLTLAYKSSGGDKAMTDIVYHYTKTLNRPHAQKRHIAVFRKYYIVIRGVTFGFQYRVTKIALDYFFSGG